MTTSGNKGRPFIAALFLGLLIVGLCVLVFRNKEHLKVSEFSGPTMGTHYQIKVVGSLGPSKHQQIQNLIDRILTDVNNQMSTYLPDSEISKFNSNQRTDWFPVSKEFASVVVQAKDIWHQSGGAFDPTILPLVEAWGFGAKEARPNLSKEDIQGLLKRIGMNQIEVRDEPPSLRKAHEGLNIDLSAIAKGHGVDRIAEALTALGYTNYMVEIGGELRVLGESPSGKPWTLGIEKPGARGGRIQKVVQLDKGALATSGDYRNYREVGGKRLSHIIDPTTGYPLEHRLVSVSVIAETCALADGWSTTLFVLGPEKGIEVANKLKLAAYLLVMTDDGYKEMVSEGFNRMNHGKEH